MSYFENFSQVIWSEKFWLPPNYTWEEIRPGRNGINCADYNHLIWPIPLSVLIISFRYIAENFVIQPIGKLLGIKATKLSPPQQNEPLEAAYRKQRKLNKEALVKLSKQLDMSVREIESWWRRRRAQDKPTTLVKFSESCWKCIFYLCNFSFGLHVLWDKKYFWDLIQCAYGYPVHGVSNEVWWYYMISLAFYWSLAVSQFFDNKRKDFWQMFIHHVFAVLLISLSWVCNLHRIGSLILVVHDCADVFLEAAKLLNYAKLKKACDIVFGIFTIVWIVTRLGLYPRLIFATIFQSHQPSYPMYFLFNGLLLGLMVLHFIWTYMIFQMIVVIIKSGGVESDIRSSSEEDEISDDPNGNQRDKSCKNCEKSC